MVLSSVPAHSRLDPQSIHDQAVSSTVYGSTAARLPIPRFELGEEEMPARNAARFIHDELLLDGTPALNLASFVTTFMEPEVEALMLENLSKNFIDLEEYPSCGEIESRCVSMVARLFHAPMHDSENEAMGVSTIGSSEAIILAVLAAKKRWQIKRRAEGKSTERPNLVMSAAVQVCWEKAVKYMEVEPRYWNCKPDSFLMDPAEAVALVDENTILLCGILGTTYTGGYEDIEKMNDLLAIHNKKHNLDCMIHVDAASGGFVAPFVVPDLKWDFRLPLVVSINASGHKYGLAYAGVGWAVWRSKDYLPDDILFTVNYLGAPQVSFTLNFSKSAVQVIGQYYQFIRLGKAGYRAIMSNLTEIADKLADQIMAMGDGEKFVLLSETSGRGLPLIAWRLKDTKGPYDEYAIAAHLRMRGWIVPAYTMAPGVSDMKLLRVVVREDFSQSRSDAFIRDLKEAITFLDEAPTSYGTHLASHGKGKAGHDAKLHRHVKEQHSLSGKHDKTHAIC